MANQHKVKIRSFLAKYIKDKDYLDEDHLFEKGYISSLMAMELVMFVESEFPVKVENDELNFDNFKSVNAISQFIDHKLSH